MTHRLLGAQRLFGRHIRRARRLAPTPPLVAARHFGFSRCPWCTLLGTFPQPDRANLSWTGTGDNASAGTAASFDNRVSKSPITGDPTFQAPEGTLHVVVAQRVHTFHRSGVSPAGICERDM